MLLLLLAEVKAAAAIGVRLTESSRLLVRRLPVYYEGISGMDNIMYYVS